MFCVTLLLYLFKPVLLDFWLFLRYFICSQNVGFSSRSRFCSKILIFFLDSDFSCFSYYFFSHHFEFFTFLKCFSLNSDFWLHSLFFLSFWLLLIILTLFQILTSFSEYLLFSRFRLFFIISISHFFSEFLKSTLSCINTVSSEAVCPWLWQGGLGCRR